MGNGHDSGLLAASDIADLAGVSRAAVSNWRRREADFPPPVGGTKANPLFDRTEVERWLAARRPHSTRVERVPAGLAMWSVMNRFRGELPMSVVRGVALSVVCARKLAQGSRYAQGLERAASHGGFFAAVAALADGDDTDGAEFDPRWAELVALDVDSVFEDLADRLAQKLYPVVAALDIEELPGAADYLVTRVLMTEGRTAGEHGAVRSRMSRLLAEFAQSGAWSTVRTVYDPACGIGEALIQFWRRSADRSRLRLFGSEVVPEYARICRQRCFLYGAEATIVCDDVLFEDPLPGLKADVVLAEPPFGAEMTPGFSLADPRWAVAGLPPKNSADTAWLQHVVAHLAGDGRGWVVTGLAATSAPNSTSIRRLLVQRGCVEAVAVLPPKLLTYTPIATALWVLRSPDRPEAPEQILFSDASEVDRSEKFELPMLTGSEDSIEHPDAMGHPDVVSTRVGVEEVLADAALRLDPRHWTALAVEPDEVMDRYRTAVASLDLAIETIEEMDYSIGAVAPAARSINIGELEKQGAIRIIRGGNTAGGAGEDSDDEGGWLFRRAALRTSDVPPVAARRPKPSTPSVATRQMIREGLASRHNRGATASVAPRKRGGDPFDISTWPGDILAVPGRAMVDNEGGWIPGPGVVRLIVEPAQFNSAYVAECLNSSWNQQAEASAPMSLALKNMEIPLIPLDDQIQLVEEFRQARKLAEIGKLLTGAAEELVAVRLDAIRYNVKLAATSFGAHPASQRPSPKGPNPFGPD